MNTSNDSLQNAKSPDSPATGQKKRSLESLIFVLVIILLLIGNAGQFLYIRTLQQNYKTLDAKYSPEYLQLNSITVNRFYQMIDEGEDCLIYISRPSCPSCSEMAPALHDLVEELNMSDDLYYFNVQPIRPTSDDPGWVDFKKQYGNIEGTPSFIHIKDGETIDSLSWPEDIESVRTWLLAQK